LKILEIYPCLQGEGLLTGVPTVLVRTAGCNLDCVWCDTRYSIKPDPKEVTTYSPEELINHIDQEYSEFRYVMITGGEPMIQKDIYDFISLIESKVHVTVETNGTIIPIEQVCFVNLWSVSPKLSSTNIAHLDRDVDYKFWIGLYEKQKNVQMKFVLAGMGDYREMRNVLTGPYGSLLNWGDMPIILQPAALEGKDIGDRMKFVECEMLNDGEHWKKYNVRLMIQQHKIAWESERLR